MAAQTPDDYIASLEEPRRSEIARLDALIRATVPDQKRIFIHGAIGYGPFHYKYKSGQEGDTCKLSLASRKQYISLYCCAADANGYVAERYKERLPKASIGKSCVRFKRVDDLDEDALKGLIRDTVAGHWGDTVHPE